MKKRRRLGTANLRSMEKAKEQSNQDCKQYRKGLIPQIACRTGAHFVAKEARRKFELLETTSEISDAREGAVELCWVKFDVNGKLREDCFKGTRIMAKNLKPMVRDDS
jgi:hypothetical protein